jgi:hypothetical protein
VEGISLLLGNNKVIMEPIVSDEPSYEENELGNTEVFSACEDGIFGPHRHVKSDR